MSFHRKRIVFAGVAFAGLAMAGCTPSATVPATTVPATTVPATSGSPVAEISSAPPGTTSAKPAAAAFGPDGFGKLKIGMKLADAVATGQIEAKPANGSNAVCAVHDLTGRPKIAVHISAKLGLAVITAPPGARTPEGVAEGDSIDKVREAYPHVSRHPNAYVVDTSANSNTRYQFYVTGAAPNVVSKITLVVKGQDCFG